MKQGVTLTEVDYADRETCLVSKALEEGCLQLWDKRLQARSCFGNEQANGVQQCGLHLPCQPVPYNPDHWACSMVACQH